MNKPRIVKWEICIVCGARFIPRTAKQKTCGKSCGSQVRRNVSLCWNCKNYHCNWLAEAKPVEGWEATERPFVFQNGRTDKTYRVTKCPEFIE